MIEFKNRKTAITVSRAFSIRVNNEREYFF